MQGVARVRAYREINNNSAKDFKGQMYYSILPSLCRYIVSKCTVNYQKGDWYEIKVLCMYVCIVITYNSKSKDQSGKVANPARGRLMIFYFVLLKSHIIS